MQQDNLDFVGDIFSHYSLITYKEYSTGVFSHFLLVRYKILSGNDNQIIDGLYFGPVTPNPRGDVNAFLNPPFSQVYMTEADIQWLPNRFVYLSSSNITAVGNFIAVLVYPVKRLKNTKPKTSF